MDSLNVVVLIGNVTVEPELNTTQGGTMRGNFSLAVNNYAGDEQETTFVPITCWSKVAENVSKYVDKGDPVAIMGRLEISQWEDNEGNKRKTTRVIANNVQFLSSGENNNQEQTTSKDTGNNDSDDPPFAT